MTVVTLFPTANEVAVTGLTNPNNDHADDGSYATCAPAKNTIISTRYKTFGFDAQLPSNAIITKVQVIYQYKTSSTSVGSTARVTCQVSGIDQALHTDSTLPAADTIITVDVTADRGWTRADLLDSAFKVEHGGRRAASNTAITFSFDYIQVEVTYTLPTGFSRGYVIG